MFNGSLGRLELEVVESQYRLPADHLSSSSSSQGMSGLIHGTDALPNAGHAKVTVHPLWEKPYDVPVEYDHAGHGGGDERMLSVLFGAKDGEDGDKLGGDAAKKGADEVDGAMALAVGLMANKSFEEGKFVHVDELGFGLE